MNSEHGQSFAGVVSEQALHVLVCFIFFKNSTNPNKKYLHMQRA